MNICPHTLRALLHVTKGRKVLWATSDHEVSRYNLKEVMDLCRLMGGTNTGFNVMKNYVEFITGGSIHFASSDDQVQSHEYHAVVGGPISDLMWSRVRLPICQAKDE